jgi:hypothetical protein
MGPVLVVTATSSEPVRESDWPRNPPILSIEQLNFGSEEPTQSAKFAKFAKGVEEYDRRLRCHLCSIVQSI